VLADPEAAAAAPAGLQCLLGARGPASTSRGRFCRGPALSIQPLPEVPPRRPPDPPDAPAFAVHCVRPVGELDCRRGWRGSLPRAPLL